jgi:glycine hydroxymethyltransferase
MSSTEAAPDAANDAPGQTSSTADFFSAELADADAAVFDAITNELGRQHNEIELIASENIVSKAVLQAAGTVLANKYAEGYPGRRYYAGCEHVDIIEQLAIDRAKQIFGAEFVNVQPHSGSQANQAVFMALARPGDTIMGLSLAAGGHLTHGAPPNQSGKWFNAVQYGVRQQDALIDYEALAEQAAGVKPKIIVAGGSAYPRTLDFQKFRAIADDVGAVLMVDMAHFAGLVAGGVHPSPVGIADVVTTTTHKTLRAARGGMILTNDAAIAKKINSAIFPGLQGGPLLQMIAGKAVGFGEALRPDFKIYAQAVVDNAQMLSKGLAGRGFDIVSGGTDTHLMLVDLRSKGVTGKDAEAALTRANITCNKNGVPFDPEKPTITSGIRLGTPAATTRGFGVGEFAEVAGMIADVLEGLAKNGEAANQVQETATRHESLALCNRFPIYGVGE